MRPSARPRTPPLKPAALSPIDPGFLHTLALLRWSAAAGQSLAIVVTLYVLELPLPAWPLWAGVAALLGFNVYVTITAPGSARPSDGSGASTRSSVTAGVAVAHLAFDIAELTWAIAWSGGPMNPFVSLFLVSIALATLALPIRHIVLIAALATLGYALAATLGPALPHIHGLSGTFNLHLWGMAVNFGLSAIVFVAVLTQLAAARDAREHEIARLPADMVIVQLTGYASVATAVEAIKRGADDYLPKPAGIDSILRALNADGSPDEFEEAPETMTPLKRLEWEHIQQAPSASGGGISAAARLLGMHRRSLQRKLGKPPVAGRG